jgi:glycosyltransferase involved in cell wall biosynthesis
VGNAIGAPLRKVVVAHANPFDHYEVAVALAEQMMLEALVTDLYWPADRGWAKRLEVALPRELRNALRRRYSPSLQSGRIRTNILPGTGALLSRKLPFIPGSWQRKAIRFGDARLGHSAGDLAREKKAPLLCYSYYAYHAFKACGETVPRILFQVHPHPAFVRDIFERELRVNPKHSGSLLTEWELALPRVDFSRLDSETHMADYWIAASTFTRTSLVANGIPQERIHVAPYGVNTDRFRPREVMRSHSNRLRLLFVGSVGQRKGIRYLLEAMQHVPTKDVQLVLCGQVVEEISRLPGFSSDVIVRGRVSDSELLEEYQSADIFVLPSLAEGFGHVLLEALACGLPVIASTNTAGPDIVDEGQDGFIVAPSDSGAIAARIQWFLAHRRELLEMSGNARRKATLFGWPTFRANIRRIVREVTDDKRALQMPLIPDQMSPLERVSRAGHGS